jgi:hypothetical protein
MEIFRHHQRMEFTFHTRTFILVFVSSTVRHHELVERYDISISQMAMK